MNINDYFVVFYAENKPIADFDFSRFSDPSFYIYSCIKNGKYRSFTIYTHDDCEYSFEIPRYDYHIYWPSSLLRLYNRLVFHHNIISPSLSSFRRYKKENYNYWSKHLFDYHFYIFKRDFHCSFMNKFRLRFKSIIVMK